MRPQHGFQSITGQPILTTCSRFKLMWTTDYQSLQRLSICSIAKLAWHHSSCRVLERGLLGMIYELAGCNILALFLDLGSDD